MRFGHSNIGFTGQDANKKGYKGGAMGSPNAGCMSIGIILIIVLGVIVLLTYL